MSAQTSIEWTDRTWNPVTGCRKISPGCKNCYAEGVALRFWPTQYPAIEIETGGPAGTVTRSRRFTDVMTHADRLGEPLSWRKPQRVFVNSMSDLFHEDVPDAFIFDVFEIMERAKHHTFQVLTKRPERMVDLLGGSSGAGLSAPALPNVWLGVSVEDQQRADERIPLLLQTPAAVRFISAEPLLSAVDLTRVVYAHGHRVNAFTGGAWALDDDVWLGHPFGKPNVDSGIEWVIVGGESGHGARPCNVEWVEDLVKQCSRADVPCFVKQLGADPFFPYSDGARFVDLRLRNRKGGDMSEWPEELRVREFPSR